MTQRQGRSPVVAEMRILGRTFLPGGMAAILGLALLAGPALANDEEDATVSSAAASSAAVSSAEAAETASSKGDSKKASAEGDHRPSETKGHGASGKGHSSRLPDKEIPLQLEGFPQRPKPIIELGEPFLGTGTLSPGWELPTGAVWQPSLLVFGNLRAALQSFDNDGSQVSELAARLDLFANLSLSGSERIVLAFRNLDQDGRFTRYTLDSDLPGQEDGFEDELNAEITSLFFEGDFGEIFPNLDRDDFGNTDVGFSLGRQPLFFQEGILINDSIDAIGLTRNTLLPKNTSNFRTTLLFGWNNVHRGSVDDDDARIFGLLTSTDFRKSTVDADFLYVTSEESTGDLASVGISAVQRLGQLNSSFRILGSVAVDEETPFATDGVLLFSELSWTPHGTHDLMYINTFAAIDEFSSASRGPGTGGPLGRAGISFAAVGLGSYGAALSSRAREVVGGAVGYQKFMKKTRRQLIVELAGRVGTANDVSDAAAVTLRYQMAFGRRFVLVLDGFGGWRGKTNLPGAEDASLFGGRLEWVTKF
ncbi:MAG: hypothetical protein K0U98_05555 [Deltaproteobacteria bacterium]|nr:hypothetical protein [Deltaproteobacteria bacterium]